AAERRHERAGCDERADARNGQGADANEPAERPSQHATRGATGRSALGRLGAVLVREVAARSLVGEEDRDVVVREPGILELVDDPRGLRGIARDAENSLLAHV